MSISWWIEKKNVVHVQDGILFNHKDSLNNNVFKVYEWNWKIHTKGGHPGWKHKCHLNFSYVPMMFKFCFLPVAYERAINAEVGQC